MEKKNCARTRLSCRSRPWPARSQTLRVSESLRVLPLERFVRSRWAGDRWKSGDSKYFEVHFHLLVLWDIHPMSI